jgi:hypothetical protein
LKRRVNRSEREDELFVRVKLYLSLPVTHLVLEEAEEVSDERIGSKVPSSSHGDLIESSISCFQLLEG